MPNPLNVPLTPPREAFIDPKSGQISRSWYMFFLSLYQTTGNSSVSVDDLQKGPPMLTVDEINNSINKATENLAPSQDGLLAQIAELQKRLDALEAASADPQLGTMAPMNKDFMDFIGFNQNADHAAQPGQITWNSGDGCLDIGMGYDGVVLQTGMEMVYRIKASSTITNGQCVMFDGSVGASGVLKGKPSTTGITQGQLIMGVATMDMATNAFGYVTSFGLVRGINTTGASVGETWADGQVLYYNPAYTGSLTNVEPAAPNAKVIVAAVVNAGSGGFGSLFIRPTFLPSLGDLTNVMISSPANGDKLIYNSTSGRWENDSRSYLMLE
jgi:subtilisin family serine protease